MTGSYQAMIAAAAGGNPVRLPPAGLFSSVEASVVCTAALQFRTDGWVWRAEGTGTMVQHYRWLHAGASSSYQVRATAVGGSGLTSGPTVFTTISSTVAFTRQSGVANVAVGTDFTLEIQRVAAPGVIVASCPAGMTAERYA